MPWILKNMALEWLLALNKFLVVWKFWRLIDGKCLFDADCRHIKTTERANTFLYLRAKYELIVSRVGE